MYNIIIVLIIASLVTLLNIYIMRILSGKNYMDYGNFSYNDNYSKQNRDTMDYNYSIGLIIIGILSIFIAFLIPNIKLSSGIGLGGLYSLLYGYISYWRNYNDYAKLAAICIGLIGCIIGVVKFSE